MRRFLTILLAVPLLAVSCGKSPGVDPSRGLSLSGDATVNFGDTRASLTILARVDWTLTSNDDWMTPDITSGKAESTTTVTFTLTENTGDVQRKGTATVTAASEETPYTFTLTQNPENVLSGVNEWIYSQMKGWYYWNDAVKAATPPDNSLAYDEFLETLIGSLRWSSVQDTSNGENPPTIDGQWNAAHTARDRIYSYIERFPASTRADESNETTFGFDIEPVSVNNANQLYLLVRWVQPGSPADKAGLKRGTWITKYNGADIYESDYENFWYRLHLFRGGTTMSFTDGDNKPYSLQAAPTKVTPIFYNDVIITSKGKKVAYLVYNQFESGNGGEFDSDLRTVFGGFKSGGATELVLDLRYNPGGYVSSCQILTSLAAGVGRSDVFIKMLRNKNIKDVYPTRVSNPEVLSFLNEKNSLGLTKIYVLETVNSASASEMVINALRGADIEVVHIGTRTNGKNVGMDLQDAKFGDYEYEMWPITFKILNAKDFTDYAGGFEPNWYIDEFRDIKNGGNVLHDFGDTRERLLKSALTLIDGGTLTPDPKTRADASARREPPFVEARRGGAKYIPQEQQ